MQTITSVKGEYVERRGSGFRIRAEPGIVEIDECELLTDAQLNEFVLALHACARDAKLLKRKPGYKPSRLPKNLNNGAWPSFETKAG